MELLEGCKRAPSWAALSGGRGSWAFFKSILGTKVLPKRIRNRASSGPPTHGRVTLVVI